MKLKRNLGVMMAQHDSDSAAELTRLKVGYEYAATTQIYKHSGDDLINREPNQCAGSMIDKTIADKSNRGGNDET